MNKIVLTVFILAVLAVGILVGAKVSRNSFPPILPTFEKMGGLVTYKVNVADIVEFTKDRDLGIPYTQWKLDYAGTKVVLLYRGDCLLITDLTTAKYESVDDSTRTATIVLSPPTVKQARLNYDDNGTHIVSLSNQGIEPIIPDNNTNRKAAIDGAMKLAQQRVAEVGNSAEVIREAKDNAERVLKAMYSGINWSVNINWKQ